MLKIKQIRTVSSSEAISKNDRPGPDIAPVYDRPSISLQVVYRDSRVNRSKSADLAPMLS